MVQTRPSPVRQVFDDSANADLTAGAERMATRENRMADVEHVIARLVVEAVATPANAA
jgi:transcription elongation GreA/GreB family factor